MNRKFSTLLALALCAILYGASPVSAQISLGTASSFGALAGSTVTNTGATTVNGNVGVSPGTSVTGFPPGLVVGGAIHSNDATASQAQTDLTTAYNAAAGTACNVDLTGLDLGGLTLTPGVYCFSSSAGLTGTLTLDFQGNPNALFIFKIGSTLITASASSVALINNGGGTCPPNVFWQVGTSATLGTGSTLAGNILALTSITMTTGARLDGRALARNGAVTLDTNNVTACAPAIVCPIITVNPATLPNGAVGTAYNQTVSGAGGSGAYTFAVTSGALPTGLVLNGATGAITGTPTAAGTFNFTITATDTATGCLGSRAYTVAMASAPGCPVITLSPSTLPSGFIGIFYNQTITATGGAGAPVFAITAGALPPGLVLNPATGVISGFPTAIGLFSFTITVTQSGCTGSQPYTITIAAVPPCLGHCNDDSCDIAGGGAPAATLLLPYFEVDLGTAGTGRTTIFSVTNVSPYAQIAHVVLYTDWSFPVLDFNIFLTGYDVQPINLFDIIARGLIASTTGTSISSPNARSSTTGFQANGINSATATGLNPSVGTQPFSTGSLQGNPNFLANVTTQCAAGRLPGQLPTALATDVRALLSTGRSTGAGITCPSVAGGEAQVGGNHGGTTAIGYATIDVAATCSQALPVDPGYFTGEILFDNVLVGDYADINQSTTAGNYAGGNPMVHIRAIPEGGSAGATIATNLPFTFYDRYQFGAPSRTQDRRQPLPSAFAARWISGTGALFDTQYKVWREGYTTNTAGPAAVCDAYVINSALPLVEIVRFDERENAGIVGQGIIVSPPTAGSPTMPEASRQAVTNSLFPIVSGTTDAGGWTYFNLSNGGNTTAFTLYAFRPYNATRPGFSANVAGGVGLFQRDVSQNWVIVQMFAEGRFGIDEDASWMGNGCTPAAPAASSGGTAGNAVGRIAPLGGVLVCQPGSNATALANGQCTGTNTTP